MLNAKKKEEIIKTNVCPAIIFALKRIARLKALIKYEKISIGTNINNKNKGASGTKIFKKLISLLTIPTKKTDVDIVKDKKKIITIWLVKAIPKGIKLNKLQINIKKNNVKINGK